MNPIAARRELQQTTLYLGQALMPTRHGEFAVHFFRDLAHDRVAMAIACGDLHGSAPLLVRVHSSCLTSECLSGLDCDCAEQLDGALGMMAREGDGILFYLMQEGRGAGLTAKARDRMIVQASENRKTTFEAYAEMGLPADLRRYDILAPMSRLLGLRAPLRLLTNNPDKAVAVSKAFANEEIDVCRMERILGPTSPFNRDYLAAKHDSGHALTRPPRVRSAKPPVDVRVVAPFVLPGIGHRVLTASYFLPVSLPAEFAPGQDIEWFRLSVIFDGQLGRESVVLAHRDSTFGDDDRAGDRAVDEDVETHSDAEAREARGEANANMITMSLLDRLPSRAATGRVALREALMAIRRSGRGSVVVSFDDRECAIEVAASPIDSRTERRAKAGAPRISGHRAEG
jgi:GTP cyclohydrolase II